MEDEDQNNIISRARQNLKVKTKQVHMKTILTTIQVYVDFSDIIVAVNIPILLLVIILKFLQSIQKYFPD